MIRIKNDAGFYTNLHFAILTNKKYDDYAVCLSIFDRSKERLKSFWATLHTKPGIYDMNYRRLFQSQYSKQQPYANDISSLSRGKENAYHLMAYAPSIGTGVDICHKDRVNDSFYSLLMNNTKLPLLKEWAEPLLKWSINKGYASVGHSLVGVTCEEAHSIYVDLGEKGGRTSLSDIEVVCVAEIETEWILCGLKELLASKQIKLTDKPQKSFDIKTLDDYLSSYGHSIVENLKKVITPLTELNGNIETCALKSVRLYPQQIAQVHGGVSVLDKKNYVLLNMGMGVGKTIQSITMCETREVEKWLKRNPGKTVKDAYSADNVHYRAVVMCPGHLPHKWAKEIERNIPYAKTIIITSLEQVLSLRNSPRKLTTGKEFYIIGKDFAKLSYTYKPAPTRVRSKEAVIHRCSACNTKKQYKGEFECDCGSKDFTVEKTGVRRTGLVCPSCGELLFPYQDKESEFALQPKDFSEMRDKNSFCYYCGSSLWEPCVSTIDTDINSVVGMHKPVSKWRKIKHYTNARQKATKSVWVMEGFEDNYLEEVGKANLGDAVVPSLRKISPALVIKKYLKNFFDYGIFDEAHLYKGGATAQGNAFAALVKACKKQLLLTGTIANGYANSIFYLLYRVDPGLMRSRGYKWTDEVAFVKKYGTLETKFKSTGDDVHLASCRGKQLTTPKVKAGISPLLVLDLLLPVQLTLDLSDMSKFLPPLKEKVIPVDLDEEVLTSLKGDIAELKQRSVTEGRTVLSTMLQYALSYPDKPYGRGVITSAIDGSEIVEPGDFRYLIANGCLLGKERELVKLVSDELSEGRNCVVYCEFTNSDDTIITRRVKEVLSKNVPTLNDDSVVVIESTSPKAIDREAWMHAKAREGAKVFIVNPRCVETGLDFVWTEKNELGEEVEYNFPTLIFYQSGYNLYTLWQASRRAYRLCQNKECRNYYLAYSNTIQTEVLQILAEKQTATSAVQGKFSAEGLAAMAKQVDPRVRLAKSLCESDTVNVNELQNMFDAVNSINAESSEMEQTLLSNYVPMKLFSELVEGVAEVAETKVDVITTTSTNSNFAKFLEMVTDVVSWSFDEGCEAAVSIRDSIVSGKKRKEPEGQISLASFF